FGPKGLEELARITQDAWRALDREHADGRADVVRRTSHHEHRQIVAIFQLAFANKAALGIAVWRSERRSGGQAEAGQNRQSQSSQRLHDCDSSQISAVRDSK